MFDCRKLVSAIAARVGYRAYGLDVFKNRKWLQETSQWSLKQRQEWRLRRLSAVLEFAWNQIPFYREYWGDHGVSFAHPKNLEDLQIYPVLTKDVFRANWERIRPAETVMPSHISKSTGGTTGVPVRYSLDLAQWSFMQAFHLWGWSQAGYAFGNAVAIMAGGSLIPERITVPERLRNFAERKLFLFGVHMDARLATEYHERLTRHKAEFLYGYPSVIYIFSKHLNEQGLRLPRLKGVITTAEMLRPQYRQGIEKNLGCPVFNDVGSNDGGYEAYECKRHHGFHYNDLQSILEVEKTNETGPGKLLITNLWNRSTPFIRYENGDFVSLAPDPCPCGAQFPVISSIEGRTCDILTFRNGATFFCAPHIFGEMAIDGWQVVQTSLNRVEVRLCKDSPLRQQDIDFVNRVFRYHLPQDVELVVERVPKLTLTKAGKLKPVWSEVTQ